MLAEASELGLPGVHRPEKLLGQVQVAPGDRVNVLRLEQARFGCG